MPDIAGLKLIVPTSVAGSGVSVSASGKVTFTAATSISVNGCFTSAHDNYVLVARYVCASGNPNANFRLRASGTDATGSNYTRQYVFADGSSVAGARFTSQDFGVSGSISDAQRSGDTTYIYGPNLAQPTAWRNISAQGYLGAYIYDLANTHSLSTAYDGFTLYPNSSNITGALCIYGLSQ